MSDFDNDNSKSLTIRGKLISEDNLGYVCLDDIWEAAKGRASQAPKHWRGTRSATALIEALQKKVTAAYLKEKKPNHPVIYANRGRGAKGTYAHPIIAAAYAGYLSPKLEIEVREVWLRYRSGDATLADEILQKATAEENRWAGVRALSRSQRNSYTQTLKDHGVVEGGYMECTERVYLHLLGGKSFQLRSKMNLPKKSNLRDALPTDQLSYVMAAEAIAAERIKEEDRWGNTECAEASALGASAIRTALEADRRSRQKRMLG